MKNINWLNQMKIRLGFGVTGNQGINPYATFSDYSQIIDYAKPQGIRFGNGGKQFAE